MGTAVTPSTSASATCPACATLDNAPAWRVRSSSFRRCRRCDSLFLHPPAAQAPARDAEHVVRSGNPKPGGHRSQDEHLTEREFDHATLDQVLGHVERFRPAGELVYFGAAPSVVVRHAATRGWNATGIVLDEWALSAGRVNFRAAEHAEGGLPDGSCDAVTLVGLIERLPDPAAVVEEAWRVLRDGGVLALVTPDAGSAISHALSRPWPDTARASEHAVLFSVRGLATFLARYGFETIGWHSVEERSTTNAPLSDISPPTPLVGRVLGKIAGTGVGSLPVTIDAHTFCLYARKSGLRAVIAPARASRLPRRPYPAEDVDENVRDSLEKLGAAKRLGDWMFSQFAPHVTGSVVEIGAGIGTFSRRLLSSGAARLLLVEPKPSSADELERAFAGDDRVEVVREALPTAPTLTERRGTFDYSLCQNVLEHIEDDLAALQSIAAALKPGGRSSLLVPANPWLYGRLDAAFGHHRRYSRERLTALHDHSGLEVLEIKPFNLLGIPPWLLGNVRGRSTMTPNTLRAFDLATAAWRPLEERIRPGLGLSLIVHSKRLPAGRGRSS